MILSKAPFGFCPTAPHALRLDTSSSRRSWHIVPSVAGLGLEISFCRYFQNGDIQLGSQSVLSCFLSLLPAETWAVGLASGFRAIYFGIGHDD